jgi:hypothetical protein
MRRGDVSEDQGGSLAQLPEGKNPSLALQFLAHCPPLKAIKQIENPWPWRY